METVSIRDALLSIKRDATEMLSTLKRLDRLQETVAVIGGGNPYRLTRCVPKAALDPELTDTGFAEAVNRAVKKADPLSRENGYLAVVKALVKGCDDLRRKQIKIAERVSLDPGTENEASAAKELSLRMKEALTAMEGKLRIAVDGCLDARKHALKAVVAIDEELKALWPNGDPLLRTSALNHSGADEISVIAMMETLFKQGEHKPGRKTVRT